LKQLAVDVGLECADVANFAMMIADMCGGLTVAENRPPTQSEQIKAVIQQTCNEMVEWAENMCEWDRKGLAWHRPQLTVHMVKVLAAAERLATAAGLELKKPRINQTEGATQPDIESLRDLLSLVGYDIALSDIQEWPTETQGAVSDWAAAAYAQACDIDVEVPPKPGVLGLYEQG
jgi:hypothetical protein